MKPKPTSIKPMPAILFMLSIFRQCLCRHYAFNGQGRHLRLNSPPLLLWINNHSLRIMDFASTTAMIYDSKSLKSYGCLFPNSICWSFEGSHGRSVTMLQSMTIISKDFKHCPITISSKIRIFLFQEDIECYKRDSEPLFCASKQALPDYKSVVSRSLADALLRVALHVSARTFALLSSSMSLCLMTVTILASIELFVEDLRLTVISHVPKRFIAFVSKLSWNPCRSTLSILLRHWGMPIFVMFKTLRIFKSSSLYLELFE
ncbi:hypothetical protein ISN45_Aa07g031590 [Arabidopsis thaliana x Arabidopsis arenosa]|uniref:Uncharacterized protein n=1 Tax=Arabidopsis thaliana x Arabidopsis arenosa TaxID=1240361 RepID=A0A8T1Y7V7_9BRAS|nr:hypothetical protein ISN45_Aa07g031590 [Arabidopsis thaliana x Arabidopsis arenosa]